MKSKWLSKTLWVNILAGVGMIVGQFYPPAQAFLAEHFSAVGGAWAIINIGLRLATKTELT